jgi:hypothetical protein
MNRFEIAMMRKERSAIIVPTREEGKKGGNLLRFIA